MKATLLFLALTATVVSAPSVAQMTSSASTSSREVTVAGVVVSHASDLLVLRTAVGERRIKLSADTTQPLSLATDSSVTETYREVNGELLGTTIVLDAAPVMTPAAPVTTTTTATATTTTTTPAVAAPATTVAEERADNWNRGAKKLPATASKLPLLALLGGLSLGAGLLLRRAR